MQDIESSHLNEREQGFRAQGNHATIEEKKRALAINTIASDRINQFFDKAELIVQRSGRLLTKCKPVVLKLFRLLRLLMDLGLVFWILRRK